VDPGKRVGKLTPISGATAVLFTQTSPKTHLALQEKMSEIRSRGLGTRVEEKGRASVERGYRRKKKNTYPLESQETGRWWPFPDVSHDTRKKKKRRKRDAKRGIKMVHDE